MKTRVRATVTVELEIPGDSVWDGSTSVSQVHKQALDDFKTEMRFINAESVIGGIKHHQRKITVIGEPKVHMIITDEDAPQGTNE